MANQVCTSIKVIADQDSLILGRTWGEDIFHPEEKSEYIYRVGNTIIRGAWDDEGCFQLYVHVNTIDAEWQEVDGVILEDSHDMTFSKAFNKALTFLEIDEETLESFKVRNVLEVDRKDYYDIVD